MLSDIVVVLHQRDGQMIFCNDFFHLRKEIPADLWIEQRLGRNFRMSYGKPGNGKPTDSRVAERDGQSLALSGGAESICL